MSKVITCSKCGRFYSLKGDAQGLSAGKAAIGAAIAGPAGAIVGASMGKRENVTACPYCGASTYASRWAQANQSVQESMPEVPVLDYSVERDNYKSINFVCVVHHPIDEVEEHIKQEAKNRMIPEFNEPDRDGYRTKFLDWRRWNTSKDARIVSFRVTLNANATYTPFYELVAAGTDTVVHCWTTAEFKRSGFGGYSRAHRVLRYELLYSSPECTNGRPQRKTQVKSSGKSLFEGWQERRRKKKKGRATCWVSSGGKKYHVSRDCDAIRGSKSVKEMSADEAIEAGYEPCKNCCTFE